MQWILKIPVKIYGKINTDALFNNPIWGYLCQKFLSILDPYMRIIKIIRANAIINDKCDESHTLIK